MKRLVALLLLVVTLLLPHQSEAASIALPIDQGFGAIAAGNAPSPSHPKGTLFVFHITGAHEAAAFEWDVALERVVLRKTLGAVAVSSSIVRAVRAGNRVYAVFGSSAGDDAISLMRVTPDLVVEARQDIGRGTMPSIDADATSSTVVTAFFEERPPVTAPEGATVVLAPPTKVLNVQTRDAGKLRLASTKYFQGKDGALLSPHAMPGLAARAVAIHDGHVILALPLRRATRIVTASLPKLAIETERELAWKDEPFGSLALVHAGPGVLALGGRRRTEVLGQPSMSARAENAMADSDDAIIAWQAIHRLTRDDSGRAVLETFGAPR